MSNGYEGVIYIPQSSKTRASLSDSLGSYWGQWKGCSPLCKDAFYCPSWLGFHHLCMCTRVQTCVIIQGGYTVSEYCWLTLYFGACASIDLYFWSFSLIHLYYFCLILNKLKCIFCMLQFCFLSVYSANNSNFFFYWKSIFRILSKTIWILFIIIIIIMGLFSFQIFSYQPRYHLHVLQYFSTCWRWRIWWFFRNFERRADDIIFIISSKYKKLL